jgi:hypothetical protein
MRKYAITLLFLGCLGWGNAQTTLQVVTKTIQKTVAWKPGYELAIDGEKAEVQVDPGADNNISIRAELSAKNPELNAAKADLEAWKFVVNTIGKKIYIRAYIGILGNSKPPESNLKVKITVTIPPSCPVNLINKFGKARLEKLTSSVVLTGEFCQFTLVNLSGPVKVESQYGNIDGRQLSGPVDVQSKRADIKFSGLSNSCNVHSDYGSVQIETSARTGDVNVYATKSDVTLEGSAQTSHNLQLQSSYGELNAPSNIGLDTGGSTTNVKKGNLFRSNRPKKITVETTFGKIQLR